jgi:PIN domain
MIQLVLDTSILRNDPKREKAAFRAIERLAKVGLLKLHIPYYVKQEFVTQQTEIIAKKLNEIDSGAKAILRYSAKEELVAYAQATKDQAEAILGSSKKLVADEFDRWLAETHAIVHSVKPDHGQRVTEGYFSGAQPFTSIKQRSDIPDSFIWQTILDVSKEHTPLTIVSNDGALFKAADQNGDLIAYKTLEEFVQSADVQDEIKTLSKGIMSTNLRRATSVLDLKDQHLASVLQALLPGALHGKTVRSHAIPEDNYEATITGVGDPEEVKFDYEKIEYYGANEIGISFGAKVNCSLNYLIYKHDYHALEDVRLKHISVSAHSDHYYDAYENYLVAVAGVLSLIFPIERLSDGEIVGDDIPGLIDSAAIGIDVTEISVPSPYDSF